MQAQPANGVQPVLAADFLAVIRGETSAAAKEAAYDGSLSRQGHDGDRHWWHNHSLEGPQQHGP
jgi:hypothetical protein